MKAKFFANFILKSIKFSFIPAPQNENSIISIYTCMQYIHIYMCLYTTSMLPYEYTALLSIQFLRLDLFKIMQNFMELELISRAAICNAM